MISMRQFVNEMNCRMEIVGAEYADIITDYTLESEGSFRDRKIIRRSLIVFILCEGMNHCWEIWVSNGSFPRI